MLIVALVGLLAANAGVQFFKERDRAINYQQTLETSIERRAAVFRVFSILQDMEIAQRDLILTEDRRYLNELMSIEVSLTAALDVMINELTSDEQKDRGQRLVALIRERQLLQYAHQRWYSTTDMEADLEKFSIGETDRSLLEQAQVLTSEMVENDGREIQRLTIEIRKQTTQSQIVIVALLGGILMLTTAICALGLAYFSRRNTVEGKLLDTMQKAEQASEAKTIFLASMSHEIRTPLTGILGYTELLMQHDLTLTTRRFVERIQSAATSLSAIVNDILDFSKIEAGEVSLETEPFSLNGLIENVISITAVVAERKGLALELSLDPKVPSLLSGDQARLQQVLLNLLSNAVKFTSSGSVSVSVRHEGSSAAGEHIRIEVSDTGIGIAPDKRDMLFKRFSQLDGSIAREFGGTGLGLAISRELIEMMGGQIGVESEAGAGSTFWIKVTLACAENEWVQPIENMVQPGFAVGRILLVEDSPQNQELVSTILRADGYEVDIANDGLEAIDAVQSAPYDLVLMDVQMRRLDGISAARRIRALDHPASMVPIVALTANVMVQQVNFYREAGMNDFIPKPFTRERLRTGVARWLQSGTAGVLDSDRDASVDEEHDPQSLEETRELMGDEWVRTSLGRLRDQISELFLVPNDAMLDQPALIRGAHIVVTSSAQLGFFALSRRCSELEEHSISGDCIDLPLANARRSGLQVVKKIDELLDIVSCASSVSTQGIASL